MPSSFRRSSVGTPSGVHPRRLYTVDLWSPPSDPEWVELLARSTLCYRSPGCEVIVVAPGEQISVEFLRDVVLPLNLNLVRQVKPHTNGECFLVLESGAQVKVSRSYRDVVARFVH